MRRAALLAAVFALLLPGMARAVSSTPNIVLILGDDHGWDHLGFLGHGYALTPNIDALAAQGTVFTNAHNTASVCRPSLRTYLSGLHSAQWDARRTALRDIHGPIPVRRESAYYRTLPRELQRRGYVSFEGGKMWEGTFQDAGFTAGLATSVGSFFQSIGDDFGRIGIDSFRSFLDTSSDTPFFAWLVPMLPHRPFNASAELRAPFLGLGLSGPVVSYLANLLWLDNVVGEIVAALEERELLDDTIIVYASDNGWELGAFISGTGHGKGTIYEQGIRTPLVFVYPGTVPAGIVREDLVSIEDLYPTLLDYAGAAEVPGRWGESLRPALEEGTPFARTQLSARVGLPGQHSGYFARTVEWRYLNTTDGREELYAIRTDPAELTNLAAENPTLVGDFRQVILGTAARYGVAPERLDATGRLVDVSGAPLASIALTLKGRSEDGGRIRLRTSTGTGGYFRFANLPHGDYRLSSTGGQTGNLAYAGQSGRRLAFSLPVAQTGAYLPIRTSRRKDTPAAGDLSLRGSLVDSMGAPLAGVVVSTRGPNGIREQTLTAEDGTFHLENLVAGRVVVRTARTATARGTRSHIMLAGVGTESLDIVARSRN